jgi:antitoxin (DNA-binding transcriptional repressor) of toxin-antitoxin stability system
MSVSDFKAHFCAELKTVSSGEGIIVLDHNHPVAQVLPYQPQAKAGVRMPEKSFGFQDYSPLIAGDSLTPLNEDRTQR